MDKKFKRTLYFLNTSYKEVTYPEGLQEDVVEYKEVEEEDKLLTDKIRRCGSNKTIYVRDIVYLYKKYIHPSVNICTSCGSEIMMAWNTYLNAYNKKYEI